MGKVESRKGRVTIVDTFYLERPDNKISDKEYIRMYADLMESQLLSYEMPAEVTLMGSPNVFQEASSRIELEQDVRITFLDRGISAYDAKRAASDAMEDAAPTYGGMFGVLEKNPDMMEYTKRPER